jgi:hypothetical protein
MSNAAATRIVILGEVSLVYTRTANGCPKDRGPAPCVYYAIEASVVRDRIFPSVS